MYAIRSYYDICSYREFGCHDLPHFSQFRFIGNYRCPTFDLECLHIKPVRIVSYNFV